MANPAGRLEGPVFHSSRRSLKAQAFIILQDIKPSLQVHDEHLTEPAYPNQSDAGKLRIQYTETKTAHTKIFSHSTAQKVLVLL